MEPVTQEELQKIEEYGKGTWKFREKTMFVLGYRAGKTKASQEISKILDEDLEGRAGTTECDETCVSDKTMIKFEMLVDHLGGD